MGKERIYHEPYCHTEQNRFGGREKNAYAEGNRFPAPRGFYDERPFRGNNRAPVRFLLNSLPAHRRFAKRERTLFAPGGKDRILSFCVALVVLAAIVVASIGGMGNLGKIAAEDGESPRSTPRSEWARGNMPFLYQTDPAWSNEPYAGSTVGIAGCGPTCLSMVYVHLTGNTDMDPASMASFSERNGFVDSGMTSWLLMSAGANMLGLASHEVPAHSSAVLDELAQGHPLICSMAPGEFTTTGHFIVLAGTDPSGKVIVHDPNSPERSDQTWKCDRILSQCSNLWAFERA